MRYYIKTTDPRYVEMLKELTALAGERYAFFKARAVELGFDEIGMHELGVPVFFFKQCADGATAPRKGPKIAGFKGGDRVYDGGKYHFKYSVSGRGKAFYDAFVAGAPTAPEELTKGNFYRPSISTVFCLRLGLPDGVFDERSIQFGTVFLLHDKTMVACSLPFRDDDSKEAAPVVIPDGFEEITERALVEEIKKHNESIKAD
ncbi:hypothetical protein K32_48500 [Kaistia sp. 32K]|uniref:hypothetical protein n=1 Tax=Kaistia sp. 32K TaxID=2795690 RepID=UPI00191550C8|nr:hypothetical protein [Kaistia sp. 32K]BCP56233.1 hypothetical protein K32_48500 [Kaistia sp. 32K]